MPFEILLLFPDDSDEAAAEIQFDGVVVGQLRENAGSDGLSFESFAENALPGRVDLAVFREALEAAETKLRAFAKKS